MTVDRRTRILIVDDSAVMRSLLRAVVSTDARLEVAGTATDGASALNLLQTSQADIILLDVEMPVMDGLATLRALRQRWSRIPVIMCSSLTQRGAKVTIEALACGAADYVTKPSGQSDRETALRKLAHELIPKIRALTTRAVELSSLRHGSSASRTSRFLPSAGTSDGRATAFAARIPGVFLTQPITSTPAIVVIGVSTGGPAALEALLPAFPERFPLPVLIVQHMPELFTRLLAERLNSRCRLRVREAADGDPVRAGCIYIARGNWHMETVATALPESPATLRLSQTPPENHCRPSVDVLFRSAANVYGAGVLAVVLTGMGSDGLKACRTIRGLGGVVLAQDEATSTVWGMPGAVANTGLANRVLPLEMIAPEILRTIAQSSSPSASHVHDHIGQAV
jgi:two-component system, chemotaxis family, protein-glutamate methylesterase/glutaminase